MGSIFNQVQTLSADLFRVPAAEITAATSPETLENWDSVQHLNLVLALEQMFGVQFEPEEMEQMKNIGTVVALVETKLS